MGCLLNVVHLLMLTVSNALRMSSAMAIVRSGGSFWLKPVAMVLFMCSAVLVGVGAFEVVVCGDVWAIVCGVW